MTREQYDVALAAAIRTYPAGAHEGWVAEMQNFDAHVPGLIHHSRARMTDDPAALIEGRYRLDPTGPQGPEVARDLERVWVEDIVFPRDPEGHVTSFCARSVMQEGHVTSVSDTSVVLEGFFVRRSRVPSYVSVRVIVAISGAAAA